MIVPQVQKNAEQARVTQGWDLRLTESNRSHQSLFKNTSQEAQPGMTKDPVGESSLVISPVVYPEGLLFRLLPGGCSILGFLRGALIGALTQVKCSARRWLIHGIFLPPQTLSL